jgi:hypothetical protein
MANVSVFFDELGLLGKLLFKDADLMLLFLFVEINAYELLHLVPHLRQLAL